MLKNAMLAVLVILVGVVITLASVNTYFVKGGAVGNLLWSGDEAYLFVDAYHSGWRVSYLRYCGSVIREFFGLGTPYNDMRYSVLVVHITPDNVQEYSAGNLHLDFYTPFEGGIYANNWGTLLKWSGHHFEPAGSQEEQRFRNAKADLPLYFKDVNGWSKRLDALDVLSGTSEGKNEFPVTNGGK